MAFSLNKIQLIGNLGQDAETSFSTNNVGITKFSIATSNDYKKKDSDEWISETTWHNVVGFNLSDFYKDGLKKGKKFYVEGRLSKRQYEKDGVKQYFTEVVSNQLIPLSARDADSQGGNQTHNHSNPYQQDVKEQTNKKEDPENADDDLPF